MVRVRLLGDLESEQFRYLTIYSHTFDTVPIPGKDIRMMVHPVTRSQYLWFSPMSRLPMTYVSWYDAVEFCEAVEGRLPTEEEWEYACRAGSEGKWCFGDDESLLEGYAWYDQDDGPFEVCQKKPNAWGLYDMHGNVWEWCSDLIGSNRVRRGGSWIGTAGRCWSSSRDWSYLANRLSTLGFRVVWD